MALILYYHWADVCRPQNIIFDVYSPYMVVEAVQRSRTPGGGRTFPSPKRPRDSRRALISVAESLDTASAGGRLVITIMAAVSQWEREAIGERTRDALRHKRS